MLHMDVTKVNQEFCTCRICSSISDKYCSVYSKCFICFRRIFASVFYQDVAYILHICCKSMFQMFQSYVAASVFML
jgi:hypothetical protein